jgi:hypothetical protein
MDEPFEGQKRLLRIVSHDVFIFAIREILILRFEIPEEEKLRACT